MQNMTSLDYVLCEWECVRNLLVLRLDITLFTFTIETKKSIKVDNYTSFEMAKALAPIFGLCFVIYCRCISNSHIVICVGITNEKCKSEKGLHTFTMKSNLINCLWQWKTSKRTYCPQKTSCWEILIYSPLCTWKIYPPRSPKNYAI